MRLALGLGAAAVLAIAGYWYWYGLDSPRARQREIARSYLNDPDSAVFRNDAPAARGSDTWCGEINARNRMGGMVGFTRYILVISEHPDLQRSLGAMYFNTSDSAGPHDPTSDAAVFESKWRTMCEP